MVKVVFPQYDFIFELCCRFTFS